MISCPAFLRSWAAPRTRSVKNSPGRGILRAGYYQSGWPRIHRPRIRRSRIRPIADELHRFILKYRTNHLPHHAIGEAITYTLNQWPKFLVCLEQGILEIDNNLVENMIRPTKLGMKNWMFFGNLESGNNNALFYTLLANCRAHGLEPETYLTEVIKRLPNNATPEQAAELTPARIAAAQCVDAEQMA